MIQRIVSNMRTGEWFIETPKSTWSEQLRLSIEEPNKYPTPMPMKHKIFDEPKEYGCYYLTSIK